MTKVLTGEWRVLGFRTGGSQLLVRPLEEQELPEEFDMGGVLAVGTRNYGGDLGAAVDELDAGYRIRAGIYPGDPGRFTECRVLDAQRLLVGFQSDVTPTVVHEVWNEAAASYEGDEPLAVTRQLDVPDTVAELYVAAATKDEPDDLWWTFVAGDVEESFYESFEHAAGRPAEFVAANPPSQPYFWVVKFADRDTQVAKKLARGAGITSGPQRELDALLSRAGLSRADISRAALSRAKVTE
ncbi:hypothetical protein [Haloarchaeobius sp. TZWWS8]|uniref:hypothetical protein n=1 Tax=Haloarchaeobius sp. TZWWS8 TaxID=3446121 RepID=UPI003EC105DD